MLKQVMKTEFGVYTKNFMRIGLIIGFFIDVWVIVSEINGGNVTIGTGIAEKSGVLAVGYLIIIAPIWLMLIGELFGTITYPVNCFVRSLFNMFFNRDVEEI